MVQKRGTYVTRHRKVLIQRKLPFLIAPLDGTSIKIKLSTLDGLRDSGNIQVDIETIMSLGMSRRSLRRTTVVIAPSVETGFLI